MKKNELMTGCLGLATLFFCHDPLRAGTPQSSKKPASSFQLPALFQPNRGQGAEGLDYIAHGFGYSIGFTPTRANLLLSGAAGTKPAAVALQFLGANAQSQPLPLDPLGFKSSFFVGKISLADIPNYSRLKYAGVWPGIDVVYYGNNRKLEYDFVVAPGADPSRISFRFEGLPGKVSSNGDLILENGSASLVQKRPLAYQTNGTQRTEVAVGYRVAEDGSVGLEIGQYDRSKALTIDPIWIYEDLLFNLNIPAVDAYVATDQLGLNTYVASTTAPQTQQSNANVSVIEVINVSNIPGVIIGAVTVGNSVGNTIASGIDVDSFGNIYAVGFTSGQGWPTTSNAVQSTSGSGASGYDGVFFKLNNALNNLTYSTYLGGTGDETYLKVAVNPATQVAYIGGTTSSNGWPVANTPASQNGFLYVIDTTLAGTASNTFAAVVGGSGTDAVKGVAVDSNANVYVAGVTNSTDFAPIAATGYQTSKSVNTADGFVIKYSSSGTVVWSTFYAGAPINAIAQYSGRYAYVTGQTTGNIATTSTGYQLSGGGSHAFFAKFDTSTSGVAALNYATYLGGAAQESGLAVAVPQNGRGYISGWTVSPNFPTVGTPVINQYVSGKQNGFLAYIDTTQTGSSSLVYSAFLNTGVDSIANSIAAPQSGEASVGVTSLSGPNSNAPALGTTGIGGYVWKIGSRIWDPTYFTTQQYLDLLDRSPDSGGLTYWSGQLSSGAISRSALAGQYFVSPEFQNGGLNIIKYYIAVLGRDPDYTGWLYNFNNYISGASLSSILNNFLGSTEFTTTYGNLSNTAFVTLVYQNVLGRAPDTAGLNSWVAALNGGQTRASVMASFIASNEFNTNVRARAYADLLYMGFLRRNPDLSGLAFWTNSLGNAAALPTVIGNFITSPEYVERFM
jgi:hypothetical protein